MKARETFEINIRADALSGRISKEINTKGYLRYSDRNLIVLIHGFNVNQFEAKKSYSDLSNNLENIGVKKRITNRFCGFFWPGNLNNFLSKPSYRMQVNKSKKIAIKLSDYLVKLSIKYPKIKFTFFAHSLGCRLLLEAIKNGYGNGLFSDNKIPLVCLLAAAVPVYRVKENGSLHITRSAIEKLTGIYSKEDTVLRTWFRLGQISIGNHPFPEAVGYNGNPKTFWKGGRNKASELRIKHDEYWKELAVAKKIASEMSVPIRKELLQHSIANHKTPKYRFGKYF